MIPFLSVNQMHESTKEKSAYIQKISNLILMFILCFKIYNDNGTFSQSNIIHGLMHKQSTDSHLGHFVLRTLHSSNHAAISAVHHKPNQLQLVRLFLCVLEQHIFHSAISGACTGQYVQSIQFYAF